MDRREFLKTSGALSFAIALGAEGVRLMGEAQAANAPQINAWVRIAPDGTVTILTAGAEMGQGSMTSLPLMVAEEMDADWSKVQLEWAPADPKVYGYHARGEQMMLIAGSRAVMMYHDQLRLAGAQVRKVLIANAAQKWGVAPATLRTEPGYVVDPSSGRKLGYGEIAAFATVPATLPNVEKSELKSKGDLRLIGKPMPRRDVPLKVNGSAVFGIDVTVPGMVYASTRHSPVAGGAPESWNEAKVKAMPGVLGTVKLADGVAVIADSIPHALAARNALEVKWQPGKAAGLDSEKVLEETYLKVHADPAAKSQVVEAKGDAKSAFAAAAKRYKAEFRSDYSYHAQMEPLNAVAHVSADRAEVWEGTQDPGATRTAVAKALGFKEEQVTVHQCYMGGGFGRRTLGDYAAECARISRAVGKPVKMLWPREEDIGYGMFRPQAFQCLEAALDAQGKVAGWSHCVVGDGGMALLTGGMNIAPYYDLPNQFIELRGVSQGVRVKHWRGVAHNFNLFAIESFVDQMAVDQKVDPIAFRLERMNATPRIRACLEKVAGMCDWKAPRPEGRALGLALTERSGSLGAGVVEASVDRASGKIRVHKVWLAVDGGLVVQPEMARHNIESGIVYGLSGALHERVTLKGGEVQQSNFHDYHVLRMSDMPETIEIAFVERDAPPAGLGETGTPWVMAAISNAVYRLTGKRLQHMPFTPERVKQTLV